jgi:hypothetical protein
LPIWRLYFIASAYGQEIVDEFQDDGYAAEELFMKLYLRKKRVESILSICCGYGDVERRFVKK